MRAWLAAGLFATLAGCGPVEAPAVGVTQDVVAAASQGLTAYLDAEYEEELAMNPETLTRMGRKDLNDKLDDRSEAGMARQLAWRRESVSDMKAQFDPATLNEDARTSYDIWAQELDRAELEDKYRRHGYVFGFRGPHTGAPNLLIGYHAVDEVSDMEAYIARLNAIGVAIDQSVERAGAAAGDGIRPPRFGYERTIGEARNIVTGEPFGEGKPSPLWADAKAKIAALIKAGNATPEQAKALEEATKAALLDAVKPGYERLIAWLEADIGNARAVGAMGAQTLPDGAGWYAAALKLNTTTDMTAAEIHALGLAEVARIHAEMETIKTQVKYTGDLASFFEFMRSDKQFYQPNTDAGRARYIAAADGYLKAMSAKLPEYFGVLPNAPLEVRRVEAYREEAGGAAHYFRPTPDGTTPGIFYAHMSDMSALAMWALESLAYHEGVPGHHMQIAIATELTGVPLFRTQYGYAAYSEGWGLYAEALGKEMGFFTDPYSDFGRLSSELWRAVRLVVDTGLHDKGWTDQQAVAYALANSPRPEGSVRSEVRRYLLNPGQATAYKIGMIKIQQLREEAAGALGERFDIRAFHDLVIGAGGQPLSVLEGRVRRWIEAQKAGAQAGAG